jgi:hypothetical protein
LKTIGLLFLLTVFAQTSLVPGQAHNPSVRQFRLSDYPGQSVLVSDASANRRPAWLFVAALVLLVGVAVAGWLLLKPLGLRVLVTLLCGGAGIYAFFSLVIGLYKTPTTRQRADERYSRLLDALALTNLTRYGIADDTYRLTIAANREVLLVADYGQDTGFVIPRALVAGINETAVRVLPAPAHTDSFRAVSDVAVQAVAQHQAVSQIIVRLREGQPATLTVVYQDRLFADSFAAFVRQTVGAD